MSQTENNKHKFTQSSTGLTLSEIQDGVDFPHTGLLKSLLQTAKGNHVVKTGNGNSNDDFAITRSNSTTITVKGGSYYRNNKLHTITDSDASPTVTLTLGFTTANAYHLLVINEAGQFAIRNPTAANKVADTELNDVIVAVLTYTGADIHVQYLTNDKSANSLSIAHDNGGSQATAVYTEVGEIAHDSATNGVKFKVTAGDLTIENDAADGDIIFKGNDSDGTADLTALSLNMSLNGKATFSGDVVSGTTTLTGGSVANEGNNRVTTSTGSNGDLNAEANLVFDGSSLGIGTATPGFTLDVVGGIRSSLNMFSQTDISASNGTVSGDNIAATTNLSNSGSRTKSKLKAARVQGHAAASVYAHATISQAVQHGGLIDAAKEIYYVGMNTNSGASHQNTLLNGIPVNAGSNNPSDFYTITEANYNVLNSGDVVNGHTYVAESVFGGGAIFVGLVAPEYASDKEVIIHNVTGFALYVIAINPAIDPSNFDHIARNRFNGGYHHHTQFANVTGNDRLFDLGRLLLGAPSASNFNFSPGIPVAPHNNPYNKDAILIKPRESVRLTAMKSSTGEGGTNFETDWHIQQGLLNVFSGDFLSSQWMITSSSSGTDKAQMVELLDSFMHVPVHYTGTTFICEGDNEIVLPNYPEDGTQFAFLCIQGTTTITLPTTSNAISQFGQNMLPPSFFEVGTNPASSITLTAGDARTFVHYTSQIASTRGYQVIG